MDGFLTQAPARGTRGKNRSGRGRDSDENHRGRPACARIERRLGELIARLPGFAGRYTLVPGSVRLPWGRTFEVDFELTPVQA